MTQRRSPIVIALDLSEYARTVLEHGLDEASRRERPAVHALAVVPERGGFWRHPSPEELLAAEDDAKQRLVDLVRETLDEAIPADRRAAWTVRLHVRRGVPEEVIIDLAEEVLADLIVCGRFGHARRRNLGSTADRIVQQASCPVLVVTPAREVSASQAQCPDCVKARADSDGEVWFCPKHHTDRIGHTTLLGTTFGGGAGGSSGGTMW